MISPYAKPGLIDNTQYDFRSVLNFVEKTFHLPTRDQFYRHVNDLGSMLDFSQKPVAADPLTQLPCPEMSKVGGPVGNGY
jgi:phospholipase C